MFLHTLKFDMPEDIEAIREVTHRWAQERVKPLAAEIDTSNAFPNELWREMGSLGCWASRWMSNTAARA